MTGEILEFDFLAGEEGQLDENLCSEAFLPGPAGSQPADMPTA